MSIQKNTYNKKLTTLKPLLPRGYQRMIAESLDGIEYWEVKKSFSGLLSNEEKLYKIFTVAHDLAKITKLRRKTADQKTKSLLKRGK